MPRFGLGVYQSSPGKETESTVKWALDSGYRLIDTAARYGNEKNVGKAVKDSGIPRDRLFVVTKVWDDMHGYPEVTDSFQNSLNALDMNYVDLFLIHSPVGGKIVETWRAVVELMEQGRTRSVGVSNFGIHHLEALKKYSKILPSVNQIEVHPFLQERTVVQYCMDNGIAVMAYSPLCRARKFSHETVMNIAKKHEKTPAQVLIRWSLQKGLICIPKSVNKSRIWQNINVYDFDLDIQDIVDLDCLEEEFRTGRDKLKSAWTG